MGGFASNDNKSKEISKKMLYDMFYNLESISKSDYICTVILKTIFLP